jgi:DNA-binding PadR family transcriptional regulator
MLDKQLLKGTIPLLVLSLLASKDRYGYDLIKSISDASDGVFRFSEGSLYPVLHGLERDGRLTSVWEETGRRRRKYYRITEKGRAELAERREQWTLFTTGVAAILDGAVDG